MSRLAKTRPAGGLLAAAVAVLLCGSGSTSVHADQPASARVIVLGVDGLDVRLLDRLVATGALPSFARLYREGAVGPIATDATGTPPRSPRIWSTYATGRLPVDHGLIDFVYADGGGVRRLYSSVERKVPAAWDIASAAGKRVGVVNWWFTYPAEMVNGFVISDRYLENWARRAAAFYGGELERQRDKLVYPPELTTALAKVPSEPVAQALVASQAEAVDRNIFQLASAALEAYPVDLLMIYTRALDVLSHMRWDSHAPPPGAKPQADEIVAYLRRYDGMVGDLMKNMGPGDSLVILSDHGFERNPGKTGLPGKHHSKLTANAATLVLYGPRIRAGGRLQGVTALDVLPTILEIVGVPPSAEMPGVVVQQAFVADRRQLLARVARADRPAVGRSERAEATEADPATIERLRMLGYFDE